jgi:hypothetical protein
MRCLEDISQKIESQAVGQVVRILEGPLCFPGFVRRVSHGPNFEAHIFFQYLAGEDDAADASTHSHY